MRVINEQQVQNVFHLAAQAIVGLANRSPLSTLEANIRGTYMLLEACRVLLADHCPLEAIVVASSDKAYGDQENCPMWSPCRLWAATPMMPPSLCGHHNPILFSTFGLPIAVTRCANLYGPGDLNFSRIIPDTFHALIEGRRPVIRSDGTPKRDYLFVKDGVDGYLALAEAVSAGRCRGQAFNLGTGKPVTVAELVKRMIQVAGARLEPEILDEAAGEIKDQYLNSAAGRKDSGLAGAHPP